MINLGKQSKLEPVQVVQKANEFFGPGGLGLTIHSTNEHSARFEGGGGFIAVEAAATAHGSEVTILSQEWELQARQFLGKI